MSFGLRAIAFCFSFARELVEVPPPPKKFPRRMSLNAGRARADAEGDEADREDERQEDEDPLRLPAEAREEHRLLVRRRRAFALLRRFLGALTARLRGSSGH